MKASPWWNTKTSVLSNTLIKPTLSNNATKVDSHSWFSIHKTCHGTIDRKFTTESRDISFTKCRKIRIYPKPDQKKVINQWWNGYRYSYNKTMERIIQDTCQVKEQFIAAKIDCEDERVHLKTQILTRGYPDCHYKLQIDHTIPKIKCVVKYNKKKDHVSLTIKIVDDPVINPLKVKILFDYPPPENWTTYRNIYVTEKNNPFFEETNSWVLETPKIIRARAVKDAVANYKTICTNALLHAVRGTVSEFPFKLKKTDSWSVGFDDVASLKRTWIKEKPKHKKETIKKNGFFICSSKIKDPIRCAERIPCNYGAPMIHKDQYNSYWIIVPFTVEKEIKQSKQPECSIDVGIKNYIATYDSEGTTMKFIDTEWQSKITNIDHAIENTQSMLGNSDLSSKKRQHLEALKLRLHKKIKNMVKDAHNKIANYLVNNYSKIILGKFNSKRILESISITKSAKKKLQHLSHYKFKEYLKFKAMTEGKKVYERNEYGTTKTCPCCGIWNPNIGLQDRTFHCINPSCNYIADRDEKSALCIMLKYYGY